MKLMGRISQIKNSFFLTRLLRVCYFKIHLSYVFEEFLSYPLQIHLPALEHYLSWHFTVAIK